MREAETRERGEREPICEEDQKRYEYSSTMVQIVDGGRLLS